MTQHSIGQADDAHLNDGSDRRRPHGISDYFGKNNWFQFSLNYPSTMVQITIICYDTLHPTFAPSVAPTTPAPTLAPTEICQSIKMTVSGTDAAVRYNGIYNRQTTTINGYDWWQCFVFYPNG